MGMLIYLDAPVPAIIVRWVELPVKVPQLPAIGQMLGQYLR